MKIEQQLDAGPVMLVEKTPIEPTENAGMLRTRLAELSGKALVKAIELIEAGKAEFVTQDHDGASHAAKVEKDLCARFEQKQWIDVGHRILLLGRYLCLARSPDCANCPLNELCPSRDAEPLGPWQTRAAHVQSLLEDGATR